ncbi:MAG: hypothetical protein UW92_C0022G0012 [Candidatus Jorgensenbacteria bacterium GW2011_GWA2_45_13]|uniref:YggU family protein n=1 Tax=Candidatus Jorgensenbacteria bacterium GW2011_GWA2_45_13 TaxID=1618662 RepID=A0A0G1L4N8_9BACT|nr:MAG: hypothetical protein UW92_C0022G0012 [Candidatus Jorgensenbacteria bacterium GW2011_GWA2_45_13]
MKIFVSVKPNARREEVQKVDDAHFVVRANAPAKEGRANKRVEELLAEYFDVPKMSVWLVGGRKFLTKQKIV